MPACWKSGKTSDSSVSVTRYGSIATRPLMVWPSSS